MVGGAPFSAQHPPLPMEPAAVGPDLLMVALEAELLLLQGFLLGLQVSLGQAHVVQPGSTTGTDPPPTASGISDRKSVV